MKSHGNYSLRILLIVAICCSTVAIAHADQFKSATRKQDLDVHLDVSCLQLSDCIYSVGADPPDYFGGPESGLVNFDPFAPGWSFSFQSAPATSWQYQENQFGYFTYEAMFGRGGSFEMTAPGGLTFTGVVTSGYAYLDVLPGGESSGVDAFFSGQWSNGQYASGEAGLGGNLDFAPGAHLDTTIAPESSSLALFGSGILGLAGVLRRKLKM